MKKYYVYLLILFSLLLVVMVKNGSAGNKKLLSNERFSSYYNLNNMDNINASIANLNRELLRLKGRLLLFGEGIVYSLSKGAPVQINISTYFPHGDLVPKKISVYVDGFKLPLKKNGSLASIKDTLFSGALVPGRHSVEVYILFHTSGFLGIGRGKDYNFTASGVLDAKPGMLTHLNIVCLDTGKGNTPERPRVNFEQSFRKPPGIN